MAARKVKAKAQMIAAYNSKCTRTISNGTSTGSASKGNPGGVQDDEPIAWPTTGSPWHGPVLEAVSYTIHRMTYPFGLYLVMDIDVDTIHGVRASRPRRLRHAINRSSRARCTAAAPGLRDAWVRDRYGKDSNVKGASLWIISCRPPLRPH